MFIVSEGDACWSLAGDAEEVAVLCVFSVSVIQLCITA